MGMSDNIREGLSKRKKQDSGEQELRELINQASTKSIRKFIQRIESGEIPMDNMADFARVLGIYKEVNQIEGMMADGSGNGAPPAIDMSQGRIIDNTVESGKVKEPSEGRVDVSDMDEKDMAELVSNLDKEQNKKNEGEF